MLTRRAFFGALGLLALTPRALLSDGYRPAGHLVADSFGALHVDKVYLDGAEVKGVFELDDVAGWVRHYEFASDNTIVFDWTTPRIHYRTGVVRVTYRA